MFLVPIASIVVVKGAVQFIGWVALACVLMIFWIVLSTSCTALCSM